MAKGKLGDPTGMRIEFATCIPKVFALEAEQLLWMPVPIMLKPELEFTKMGKENFTLAKEVSGKAPMLLQC